MSEPETKRGRVRRILIDPLLTSGMRKQARMKAADYDDMLVRLADKLGHMSDENLHGLVPLITRHATGKEKNCWPDEVSVVAWALAIQPPPPRACDYVMSLMRSVAGRRAFESGYHVELYMTAKKLGPPPSRYDQARLCRDADENRREVERVRAQIEAGTATLERRQWLNWYLGQQRECEDIMNFAEGTAA